MIVIINTILQSRANKKKTGISAQYYVGPPQESDVPQHDVAWT